jgi:hypothetical protein
VSEDVKIRAAWEAYHGPITELDGYIPATPPTYERGYRDGYAAACSYILSEINAVRDFVRLNDWHWSDDSKARSIMVMLGEIAGEYGK